MFSLGYQPCSSEGVHCCIAGALHIDSVLNSCQVVHEQYWLSQRIALFAQLGAAGAVHWIVVEKCVWDCRVGKMRHDLRVIRRGESPPMGRIWEGGRVGVHIHLMPTSKTLSCQ